MREPGAAHTGAAATMAPVPRHRLGDWTPDTVAVVDRAQRSMGSAVRKVSPKQVKIPGTLPTMRAARAAWRAALAELEEYERAVDERAATLEAAKNDLKEAMQAYRSASVLLREVEDADRQQGIDKIDPS